MNRFIIFFFIFAIAVTAFGFFPIFKDDIYGADYNEFDWNGTVDFTGATLTLPDSIDGNVVYEDTITATAFSGAVITSSLTVNDTIDGNIIFADTVTSPVIIGSLYGNGLASYVDSITTSAADSIVIFWKHAVPETLIDVR